MSNQIEDETADAAGLEAVIPLQSVLADLAGARRHWRQSHHPAAEPAARELPSGDVVERLTAEIRTCLFPMRLGPPDLRPDTEDAFISRTLSRALADLLSQARLELTWAAAHLGTQASPPPDRAPAIVSAFARSLGGMRQLLDSDVLAAFAADPAARSVDEVLLCYPGVRAVINHRIAHRLHELGLPLIARMMAEMAHRETGIDIHSGASIGSHFFIDHGTGVVIGATSIIGARVQIFQGVTLGAKSFPTDGQGHAIKGLPRHPIVEDDVIIYSGATVLGRVTIGRGSILGGNVWVTEDVPPGSVITQAHSRLGDEPPRRISA